MLETTGMDQSAYRTLVFHVQGIYRGHSEICCKEIYEHLLHALAEHFVQQILECYEICYGRHCNSSNFTIVSPLNNFVYCFEHSFGP